MYTEINNKLEEAQNGIYQLNKLDSMLKELKSEQVNLKQKIELFKEVLNKENLDVDKLNKKTLTAVFYSIIGKLEERMEEEQREALSAKLKYDQAILDLEYVEQEISRITSEKMKYINCKRIYDSLYSEKKNMLIKSNEKSAKMIMDITDKLNDSKCKLKELKEAIYVGKDTISCLKKALSSLESAEGWGVWDMLGGGLISDIAKHSHIDDTKHEVEQVQNLLRKFKTELADVKISFEVNIETDGFAKFADFFFDGLIADWFMQSKINESYDSVKSVKNQVEQVVNKLVQLEIQELETIETLKNELSDIIIKS